MSLDFSPDGRFLASGGQQTLHKSLNIRVAFGMHCGCVGADHQALLWDIAEGRLIKDLPGHRGDVRSLCFSREGEVLASGWTEFMAIIFSVCLSIFIYSVCLSICL